MLDFLKKLFGTKKEESGGYIPQEYIIPKKKTPVVDEPVKDETNILTYGITDKGPEPFVKTNELKKQVYTIDKEWAVFEENSKYGYLDESGNKIIEAKFDSAQPFKNGCAIVKSKDRYGLINTSGKYILQPAYNGIEDENYGLLKLEKKDRYGFADTSGKIVIPVEYLDCGEFSEGVVWVEKNDALVGFIDKNNKPVIDFVFDYCGDFSEGLASATQYAQEEGKEDKYGFIDKNGNFVITMDYDDAGDFKEGLAPVCINGKYTFIDKKGKPVCEPVYSDAGNFVEGLSCVQLEDGDKWCYADKKGTLVIPCQFESTSDFLDDKEMVEFVKSLKLKFLNK